MLGKKAISFLGGSSEGVGHCILEEVEKGFAAVRRQGLEGERDE